MTQLGRRFCLSETRGRGIYCASDGLFIGPVPLLIYDETADFRKWKVREADEINDDLSELYGAPVDVTRKISGLKSVARALDRSEIFHARLTALHLQLPNPPSTEPLTAQHAIEIRRSLDASGLLKADWDPQKHPRWPAGSAGSIGGEFAPADGTDESVAAETGTPTISAQITIPAPLEFPGGIPFPSEIAPIPLVPPGSYPPGELGNPYPDRPECEAEWAYAMRYCTNLLMRGLLGSDKYRGKGQTFDQCVRGMVTEDCGGSPVERS